MPDRVNQRRFLSILIVLNLVRGLLYAAIVPLWQAPDEQSHFEYVALIVEQGRLPEEGSISSQLRHEIVAAMAEQNWNRFMSWKLDGGDALPGSMPDIPGPTELGHPSLYYLSSAMVIWPLRQQEISLQLYVLRLYSTLLSTLTLIVAYAAACELFVQRWRLQVAVSLLFLFIPAHTFLSTTVSNDRLAELILSAQFFLWTRVFRRGLTWRRALSIAILLGLGLWTKATTAIGIPLAGIALVIYASPRVASVFQKPTRGYLALSLLSVASLILIGGLLVDPRNAQGWNKTGGWNSQDDTLAYEGQHAIRVQGNKGQNSASVYQEVPPSTWQPLAGKQVTLKALVRTEKA
ncbi:MAG: DUF2142 domain-containing protein [Anaerolineae bacterium]|nr:MAG: DUF2142 domain-containing protein [Anaerolineae bacterium]